MLTQSYINYQIIGVVFLRIGILWLAEFLVITFGRKYGAVILLSYWKYSLIISQNYVGALLNYKFNEWE